ncbi:MAG: hypothetical protein A2Y62_10895 [Candidatus Fischerbacteria bacterium RBG_13_37_8]|uniref:Fibronectin type-III domain-containing protein n=1 Tax=Candidatus Fischerbacteria bacterium RBG_13_37_8 TaxID=1817863 RepID=A0A1F5VUU6_9BACT|nr:MAG: hypothetical protein A2Y62_10895 [Candidatus Fischerbacteria bacterium RBG_13_37_8]
MKILSKQMQGINMVSVKFSIASCILLASLVLLSFVFLSGAQGYVNAPEKQNELIRNFSFSHYTFSWTSGENPLPRINIAGISSVLVNGDFIVPQKIALLATSPNAHVSLELLEQSCREISLAEIAAGFSVAEQRIPVKKFPAVPAALGEDGFLRYQKYQEIRINPIIYRNDTLQFCTSIRIKVSWQDDWSGYEPVLFSEFSFEPTYEMAFINYADSKLYRAKRILPAAQQNSTLLPSSGYKVTINEDGIYRLTYQQLANAGLPVDTIPPRTFQLYNKGQELAIYVLGEEDGKFDTTDYIEFYGLKKRPDPARQTEFESADYTDNNVYWLYYSRTLGKRVQYRSVNPNNGYTVPSYYWYTEYLNEYGFFYSQVWAHGMNHWVWTSEVKGPKDQCTCSPASCNLCPLDGSKPFTIDLAHLYTASPNNAQFTVKLLARSSDDSVNPDHHTIIHINSCANQDNQTWDGKANFYHNFSTPHSCLTASTTVTLELLGDIPTSDCCHDRVALDSITVTYNRLFKALNNAISFSYSSGNWRFKIYEFQNNLLLAYDISDPYNAFFLTNFTVTDSGGGYWKLTFEDSLASIHKYTATSENAVKQPVSIVQDIPSFLKNSYNKADYIIITDDSFIASNELSTFVQWKESKGLHVVTVNITDIYDEFSDGIFDPLAINSFLRYVFDYWQQPIPAFVLIIGDPTYDFKDKRGSTDWFLYTPTLIGDDPNAPSCVFSSDSSLAAVNGDDLLPEFFIGRFSVHLESELQSIVAKVLQYESHTPADINWKDNITMVAGNVYECEFGHDQALERYLCTDLSCTSTLPWDVTKLYASVLNDTQMRDGIKLAINTGTPLLSFCGHGTPPAWGNFWNIDDVYNLTNYDKYVFVVNASCYTGAIHRDQSGSTTFSEVLMEAFTNVNDKGAIAAIAPSSSDSTASVVESLIGLYHETFSRETKDFLVGGIFYRTIIDKMGWGDEARGLILLGDPSINILFPHILTPQNLTATGVNLKVILDWDNNSDPIAGYNAYRCLYHTAGECTTAEEDFEKLNTTPVTQSYFEDTNVVNLTDYYYFVTAVDSNAYESAWSNMANAVPENTMPPSTPTGLTATNPKIGTVINLSWNANPEPDIEGYEIHYGTESQNYTYTMWAGNKVNFSVGALTPYMQYYFALKAKNTSGFFSNFSAEVSAIPTQQGGSQPQKISDLLLSKSTPQNVLLEWSKPLLNEANAPVIIIAYAVYRGQSASFVPDHSNPGQTNSNRIAAINDPEQPFYEDVNAVPSPSNYYYLVSAYDDDWMESSVSTDPPQSIQDLILVKQTPNISFQWSPAIPQPNSWITGYNLYKAMSKSFVPDRTNHTNMHDSATTSPIIDAVLLGDSNNYYFKLLTVDNHGNESIP